VYLLADGRICLTEPRHVGSSFILLFYFVSQKYTNKLSCVVKQISVCYIHAVTVAVFVLVLSVYINKVYHNFSPDGWR